MEAKYKIGDSVTVSDEYLREGFALFGKELYFQKQTPMKVLKVWIPKDGLQDSFGNLVPVTYEVKTYKGAYGFCENFLTSYFNQ
jgi:hypothetical protein